MRFFDHNATTPLFPVARDVWLDVNESHWLNPSSSYRSGAAVHARLEDARRRLAGLLEVDPDRVIFNSGATEGNNTVFAHWAHVFTQNAFVGISPTEHPSVIEAAKFYFRERLVWLALDRHGAVDLSAVNFEELSALSVMAANNETGLLNPWSELAEACRANGIPFHCDASQWIGKMSLNGLGKCDFLTGCAHKFGGPKGTGFLVAPESMSGGLRGGAQEHGRRAGTEDVAGILAMITALELAEEKRIVCMEDLKQAFWTKLKQALPDTANNAPVAPSLWNTLSVVLPEFTSPRWIRALEKRGFYISAGSACSTGKSGPSHVLAAMQLEPSRAGRTLRISSGWETSQQDWDDLLAAILESYDMLRSEAKGSSSQVISI
ncbi:MAG: cysteine desulfurase family protein [Verrucomicrobiota bacterium]